MSAHRLTWALAVLAVASAAASVALLLGGRHRTALEVGLLAAAFLVSTAARLRPAIRAAARVVAAVCLLAVAAIAIEPHVH